MEKSVSETLLERRCVRHFEGKPIPAADLEFIREAVRNTPTSYNGQQYSVIEITDPQIKARLAELSNMKQLANAPVVFMFLADYHKIEAGAQAKGLQMPPFYDTADGLIVAVIDASLAMMGAIVAAEARNLGTCPVGYVRTVAPREICELLRLPRETFPICALAVGIPAEKPEMKPKQPLDLIFHKDVYGAEDMKREIMEYDEEIVRYHENRSSRASDQDWIGKILFYYRERSANNVLAALCEQGFGIKS